MIDVIQFALLLLHLNEYLQNEGKATSQKSHNITQLPKNCHVQLPQDVHADVGRRPRGSQELRGEAHNMLVGIVQDQASPN